MCGRQFRELKSELVLAYCCIGGVRMPEETHLESEVAGLIVETLNLDIDPSEIDPQAPLFREGLGLDSIDALELALALSQRYGFKLRADDSNNTRIFSSLRALSEYVRAHRAK